MLQGRGQVIIAGRCCCSDCDCVLIGSVDGSPEPVRIARAESNAQLTAISSQKRYIRACPDHCCPYHFTSSSRKAYIPSSISYLAASSFDFPSVAHSQYVFENHHSRIRSFFGHLHQWQPNYQRKRRWSRPTLRMQSLMPAPQNQPEEHGGRRSGYVQLISPACSLDADIYSRLTLSIRSGHRFSRDVSACFVLPNAALIRYRGPKLSATAYPFGDQYPDHRPKTGDAANFGLFKNNCKTWTALS